MLKRESQIVLGLGFEATSGQQHNVDKFVIHTYIYIYIYFLHLNFDEHAAKQPHACNTC